MGMDEVLKLNNSKHTADIDKSCFKHDGSRSNTAGAVFAFINETSGIRALWNRILDVHNG
jgi:hypothetical protein